MDAVILRHRARGKALALDLGLVAVVTTITEANVWRFDTVPGPKWLTTALPLLTALPLAFRRSRPLLASMLVFGGIVIQAVASGNSAEGIQQIVAGGVAAYSVAAYGSRRRALVGLAAVAVAYGIYAAEDHNVQSGRAGELWAAAFFAVGLLAAWLAGVYVHSGRERVALRRLAVEHERSATTAIAAERSRLARELHDIVSHNLSVVVVQAGGARAQGESATDSALEKIERSSREALVEMRRLLGVLRENGDDASMSPQPGLADIEGLAATIRAAGLPVEVTMTCTRDDFPPALELSVYRIVQEALTNTLKHADATRAAVRVRQEADMLTVEVVDDGNGTPGAATGPQGHGLVGMRERVALFGGALHAAPRPEGGFAVRATLPLS